MPRPPRFLQEVFCDFPFDGEASRAGAIASLISSVLRPAIDGPTPLAIVDKPQPGTGASLIANVISIAASGHMAAMMGLPPSDEEWEKKLGGILMAGRTMCVIDNIETKLYSETLARYLTSPNVSVRPLGQSTNLVLPNSLTFIATGNNVHLGGDLPLGCHRVRLDAKDARPWMRKVDYRHKDLLEWGNCQPRSHTRRNLHGDQGVVQCRPARRPRIRPSWAASRTSVA